MMSRAFAARSLAHVARTAAARPAPPAPTPRARDYIRIHPAPPPRPRRRLAPTVAEIQTAVAGVTELQVDELLGDRRARMYVRPRHIAIHLAVALTRLPLAEIGRRFGDRDHTTVLHAARRIEALLRDDDDLADAHRRALQAIARLVEARDWTEWVR